MRTKSLSRIIFGATAVAATAFLVAVPHPEQSAQAHKTSNTPEQLKAFEDQFLEQVKIGDSLFHGDKALEKQMGINLSNTGMACAMCHPHTTDVHPHQFPKWQEQMNQFATLRDMVNWCIEKPNQGEKIDVSSPAMKALEAYIYWSHRNTPLRPGTH